MAECWGLAMSPAQKAVLISLADNANDQGCCWPSIATVCERTCLSERTVQASIKWLAEAKLISVHERLGRSSYYVITPANAAPPQMPHPASDAPPPPQMPHPTPANAAPRTVKEPSVEPSKKNTKKSTATISADQICKDFPEMQTQTAIDYLAVRKAKRAPLTTTAWRDVAKELNTAVQRFGITADRALSIAVKQGWQGFEAHWLDRHLEAQNGKDKPTTFQSAADRRAGIAAETYNYDRAIDF